MGDFLTNSGNTLYDDKLHDQDVTGDVRYYVTDADLNAVKGALLDVRTGLSGYETSAHATSTFVPLTQRAAASGVATLDTAAKIPLAQIPDVLLNPAAQATGSQVISGGGVSWSSGYTFTVSAATYTIQGDTYTSPLATVTLDAADATYDRIDLIALEPFGVVVVVKGTAAANPAQPTPDPVTQLPLTFVVVTAASSQPAAAVTTDLYHENAEWTATVSTNLVANSATNPHAGSLDINATTATTGNYAQLVGPGTIDLGTRTSLVFWIRSKAAWASTRSLSIYWRNGTTTRGSVVSLRDGTYGFSSSNTTAYQQIVIPLSVFGINGIPVNTLRFDVAGSGTTIGFYLDDVILQGGVAQAGQTTQPVMLPTFFPGKPGNAAVLWRVVSAIPFTMPVALAGSVGAIVTNPTATTTLTLKNGATTVGTVTISTGGVFTFAASAAVAVAAGDVLSLTNQATADATAADISVTLLGAR